MTPTVAQQKSALPLDTAQNMAVRERMAKARAAKAQKKADHSAQMAGNPSSQVQASVYHNSFIASATEQAPLIKTPKGPNGQVVHTGERGAKYYINKNGNKTYLSSNQ